MMMRRSVSVVLVMMAVVIGAVRAEPEAIAADPEVQQIVKSAQKQEQQFEHEAEVNQIKALLAQVQDQHGVAVDTAANQKNAEQAISKMEQAAPAAAAGGAASEGSAAQQSVGAQSLAAENSKLQQLEDELAELMTKKDSGKVKGEELEALNVKIELVMEKIKALKGQAGGEESSEESSEASQEEERSPVVQVVDPLMAHLENLHQSNGDFGGLEKIDFEDMLSLLNRLRDMAEAHRGATSCSLEDPCHTHGDMKVVADVKEECGADPCAQHKEKVPAIVVDSVCGGNSTHAANNQTKCATEVKSPVSTCAPCEQQRNKCHQECPKEQTTCHDQCHEKTDACHKNTCGHEVVRSDVVKPVTESATVVPKLFM